MDNENNEEQYNIFYKILNNKATIIIVFGLAIRVIMLLYYYWADIYNPQWIWGDLGNYFTTNLASTPISIALLSLFRILSFGFIEVFAFWAFFWDFMACILFYFILKSYNVKNLNYAWGLFLINVFFFLNNSFSLVKCGYNITDSFFLFFLFISFMYIPKRGPKDKYLFYIFLGVSMCIKYYTIPALGLFFIKFLLEKDWTEMKTFILTIAPVILIFLILPFFFLDFFREAFLTYSTTAPTPFIIRFIPAGLMVLFFIFFRYKKAEPLEIVIFSTIIFGSYLFFIYHYVRWFQWIIFYGILTQKEFFTCNLNLKIIRRKVEVDNHLLTFYLSFIGVLFSFLFIIYLEVAIYNLSILIFGPP